MASFSLRLMYGAVDYSNATRIPPGRIKQKSATCKCFRISGLLWFDEASWRSKSLRFVFLSSILVTYFLFSGASVANFLLLFGASVAKWGPGPKKAEKRTPTSKRKHHFFFEFRYFLHRFLIIFWSILGRVFDHFGGQGLRHSSLFQRFCSKAWKVKAMVSSKQNAGFQVS